jgi:hypothetical protein
LKTLIFKRNFDELVWRQLYIIPMEALVMEQLTASPQITDIYGYCGTTSILEIMPKEVNELIQPGSGWANHTELMQQANVKSQNFLTPKQKVGIALEMAKALADLHGFTDSRRRHCEQRQSHRSISCQL